MRPGPLKNRHSISHILNTQYEFPSERKQRLWSVWRRIKWKGQCRAMWLPQNKRGVPLTGSFRCGLTFYLAVKTIVNVLPYQWSNEIHHGLTKKCEVFKITSHIFYLDTFPGYIYECSLSRLLLNLFYKQTSEVKDLYNTMLKKYSFILIKRVYNK